MQAPSRPLIVGVAAAYALAVGVWAGGLLVLGAIVAPTVFGIVPAPGSADAMTVVFRRFDVLAIACAVVALIAEALLGLRGGKVTRADVARGASIVVAAGLAIVEGVHLSPSIHALHREGAVRGFGDAGRELERLHRLAEAAGKAELALLAAILILLVAKVARASSAGSPPD